MKPMCRHCRKRRAIRPRGLCWPCFYNIGVRSLYPISANCVVKTPKCSKKADKPTTAIPGTEDKIKALEDRVSRGQPLWNDDDARPDCR
jgi:hypothetical protein